MPWYRTIIPENEIKVLTIRARLSDKELESQQAWCPENYSQAQELQGLCIGSFTCLSAFQYLKTGIRQYIFTGYNGEKNIGVILKPYSDEPRNVYWRESNKTDVSDEIFKRPFEKEAFEKKVASKLFTVVSETEAVNDTEARYNKLKDQYIKEGLDPNDLKLPWTEGLFRYRHEEIDGIVVNLNNTESCIKGYCFAKIVESVTGAQSKFYRYSASTAQFQEITRIQLKASILPMKQSEATLKLQEYFSAKSSLEKSDKGIAY